MQWDSGSFSCFAKRSTAAELCAPAASDLTITPGAPNAAMHVSHRMRGLARGWRAVFESARLQAWALLAIALAVGAFMRFHQLQRFELTADEGASWLAASAPTARQVVEMERWVDPGKLAVYDLALHGWMRLFGDGVFAMRAMSGLLGTLTILLLFVVVREVCSFGEGFEDGTAELAGGFAALVLASNLAMSISARTVRMYPLLLDTELLQMVFFIRLHRKGGLVNYAGAACLTALAIAINFTAALFLAAEGLWIAGLVLARWFGLEKFSHLNPWHPAAAVSAGLVLLMPMARAAAGGSAAAVKLGAIDWIKPQELLWPLHVFRQELRGRWLRRMLLACAAFAVWRHWRSGAALITFVIVWVAGPMIAVTIVSWTMHPLEVRRYVLIAFLALFALAGLGMASFRNTVVQITLVVIVVYAGLRQSHSYLKGPPRFVAAWQEAAEAAAGYAAPGTKIVVFPFFAVDVIQYYLGPERRKVAEGGDEARCQRDTVAILSGFEITPPERIASIRRCYPRLVARLPEVEVRSQ
jgi:hypothetical protein